MGSGGHQAECKQTTDKINYYIRGTVAKVKGNYSSLRSAVGRPPCWAVFSQVKRVMWDLITAAIPRKIEPNTSH